MSGRKKIYQEHHVSQMKKALENGEAKYEPKKRSIGIAELVHQVREDIDHLREKGYTINQICDMIIEGGFAVAHSTLKRYVGAARQQPGTRKRKRPEVLAKKAQSVSNPAKRMEETDPKGRRTAEGIVGDREDL